MLLGILYTAKLLTCSKVVNVKDCRLAKTPTLAKQASNVANKKAWRGVASLYVACKVANIYE